jgi:hypothetical protein
LIRDSTASLKLLLRLSGGLERKLFAHCSSGIAYSLDCACKLLLCHSKMLGPMPDVIFAIENDLTAVAENVCAGGFHHGWSKLCRLSMSINIAFGELRQRLVGLLFFSQSQIEHDDGLV